MSMYNALFGRNPMSDILLAMLGLTTTDVGRFRDAYVTEEDGQPVIAVYTRNGGGNREHHVWDEHGRWDSVSRRTVERCRWNYVGKRWENIAADCEQDHDPIPDEGPECDCTGCTITYRIPAMDGYLRDEDDDFDSTYCTAYFRAPEDWRDLLAGMVREGSPDGDWQEFLAALNEPPTEAKTRPQKLAAQLVTSLEIQP